MEIVAELSKQCMRHMLLSNGYAANCAEINQLDSLPNSVRLLVTADGAVGYYDRYGDYELLLYAGQWDAMALLVI